MNQATLQRTVVHDQQACVDWCQQHGLIPMVRVCDGPGGCGADMRLRITGPSRVEWWCRRVEAGVLHHKRSSALENTWFGARTRFPITAVVMFTYLYANGVTSYEILQRETSSPHRKTSVRTLADWISYTREVMAIWVEDKEEDEGLLGGFGRVVEIDEAKIGKRKYNKGRLVEGTWVLGLIEISEDGKRRGGRFRIKPCPENRRAAEDLIPIILANVAPGTTICTDLWGAYNPLAANGYHHFTVNHSQNFVDPASGCNTQTIESSWRAMKASFKGSFRKSPENLLLRLGEFLYRREVRAAGADPFMHLVEAIRTIYPGV